MPSIFQRFSMLRTSSLWFWLFSAVACGIFIKATYPLIFTQKINDFSAFYWGSIATFQQGVSPYDDNTLKTLAGHLIFSYVYPPPSLLAFYPLSLFTYKAALSTQFTLNLIALPVCIFVVFFKLLPIEKSRDKNVLAAIALAFSLSSEPYHVSILLGQINPELLLLLVFSWFFLKQKHYALGALALSLATLFKLYPAFFIFYFLIARRYNIALYCLGYLIIFCTLSIIMLPSGLWNDWAIQYLPLSIYNNTTASFSLSYIWCQSLNGFFIKIFHLLYPTQHTNIYFSLITLTINLIVIGCSFILLLRLREQDPISYETIYFPFLLILMFLASPWTWGHHLVYVMPAFYFIFCHLTYQRNKGIPSILFLLSSILLLIPVRVDLKQIDALHQLAHYSKNFYAAIIVWMIYIGILINKLNARSHENHKTNQAVHD